MNKRLVMALLAVCSVLAACAGQGSGSTMNPDYDKPSGYRSGY